MEIINLLIEQATKHGLGIVLAILISVVFIYVLRRMLNGFEKDKDIYNKFMSEKDAQVNNHLTHIAGSLIKLDERLNGHDKNTIFWSEKIVDEIRNQTEWLKENKETL